MAYEFTMDLSELKNAVKRAPGAVGEGLMRGLTDVKNDWQTEAEQIAPLKDGHLRESISSEVFTQSDATGVEIGVSASDLRKASGKAFNYAYYIHEDRGRAVTGEKKFLDAPARENQTKWQSILDAELEKELKKAGWR